MTSQLPLNHTLTFPPSVSFASKTHFIVIKWIFTHKKQNKILIDKGLFSSTPEIGKSENR